MTELTQLHLDILTELCDRNRVIEDLDVSKTNPIEEVGKALLELKDLRLIRYTETGRVNKGWGVTFA